VTEKLLQKRRYFQAFDASLAAFGKAMTGNGG